MTLKETAGLLFYILIFIFFLWALVRICLNLVKAFRERNHRMILNQAALLALITAAFYIILGAELMNHGSVLSKLL